MRSNSQKLRTCYAGWDWHTCLRGPKRLRSSERKGCGGVAPHSALFQLSKSLGTGSPDPQSRSPWYIPSSAVSKEKLPEGDRLAGRSQLVSPADEVTCRRFPAAIRKQTERLPSADLFAFQLRSLAGSSKLTGSQIWRSKSAAADSARWPVETPFTSKPAIESRSQPLYRMSRLRPILRPP
jgi:hypothetical protein